MPTYSATRGALDLVDIVGCDLSIPFTITEDAVAFAWAGVTVVTEIVVDRTGADAAVASFTFTTGASGAATLSLTEAQKTTLGVGTYRYSIVASVGDALQWSVYGQYSLANAYDNGQASTDGVAVTITAGTVAVAITASGMTSAQVAAVYQPLALTDAGGYYTTDTVVAALQQIGLEYGTKAGDGGGMLPTGALAQSVPRNTSMSNASILSSGRESMSAVWLNAGQVITNITFVSSTTALVTGANQWFSLRDANRVLLKVTADNTTTAWGALTARTLALAGGTYTVLTSGVYYLGIMVNAATPPTLVCAQGTNVNTVYNLAPVLAGSDGTNLGLTTPATAPATSPVLTSSNNFPYCYVT